MRSPEATASILEEIQETMRVTFGDSTIAIGLDTTAEDIDGWDSLAHTRLIIALENRFGMMFPGERLFDLTSVGELMEVIGVSRQDRE